MAKYFHNSRLDRFTNNIPSTTNHLHWALINALLRNGRRFLFILVLTRRIFVYDPVFELTP
jgi:hypothetical protein